MTGFDDDRELDDFLARRSLTHRRLADRDSAEPPPELDRLVLDKARQAIGTPADLPVHRAPRWAMPVALAATVVLAFAVVLNMGRVDLVQHQMASSASRAADTSALADSPAAEVAAKGIASNDASDLALAANDASEGANDASGPAAAGNALPLVPEQARSEKRLVARSAQGFAAPAQRSAGGAAGTDTAAGSALAAARNSSPAAAPGASAPASAVVAQAAKRKLDPMAEAEKHASSAPPLAATERPVPSAPPSATTDRPAPSAPPPAAAMETEQAREENARVAAVQDAERDERARISRALLAKASSPSQIASPTPPTSSELRSIEPVKGEMTASNATRDNAAREEVTAAQARAKADASQAAIAGAFSASPKPNEAGAVTPVPEAKRANPQSWLREIEALRKAGKTAEADRELEDFRKRYPNEPTHLPRDPRPVQ